MVTIESRLECLNFNVDFDFSLKI